MWNVVSAFDKRLIDHGVGSMLDGNRIDLQQAKWMIDQCAGALGPGSLGTHESSMIKVVQVSIAKRIKKEYLASRGAAG